MIMSDRIFGLVVVLVALAFIASATQIQTSFLSDPIGPKAFPILVGSVAALCGVIMILRPDQEPEWPELRTLGALLISVLVLVAYAYLLKPLGFLVPTAIVAGVLSYQINPRAGPAAIAGVGLSVGLFVVFKFILGLSLFGLPRAFFG
jgi:putative tricarboxylic transport membrane protein